MIKQTLNVAPSLNQSLSQPANLQQSLNNSGGGSGTRDHSKLQNLDYEHAGHTGFQPAGDYATKNDVKVEFAGETFDTNQEWANTLIEELNEAFGQVWEDLSDKYEKPNSGIPKWDLHPDVQESLNKADTALQEHQDISGKQNITDNTLETYHKTVPTAINEVNSIAKGANQAVSYANYSTMVSTVNSKLSDEFNIGQNIMIVTVEVPDLWVSGKEQVSVPYVYTTDAQLISDLETNGYIRVGYFKISMLETQKVDLTDYALKTDCNEIDLSSYSVGDNITDSALISAISNDRTIIKYNGAVYRYAATYGSGRVYTVMHTLEGGAYLTLNWTGSIYNLYEAGTAPWLTPNNVDSALSSSSNNPVRNSTLYQAIVPTEVYKVAYTYDWSEPSGTNNYNSVAILTLPSGSFTDNSLIELIYDENFQMWSTHGFCLYSSEVSTQRVWITSIGKPVYTMNFKFRIWKYD